MIVRTNLKINLPKRRRGIGRWLIAAMVTIWIVPAMAQDDAQPVLVIEGATLIDGNGASPIVNANIVIRGQKFETVSSTTLKTLPANAKVIDARGKYVIPGLIDAHLHYSGFLAELLLAHGVTTAFDISGRNLYQVVQREAIAQGRLMGPRLFVPVDSVLAPTKPGGIAYGRGGPRSALSSEQAVVIAKGALADGADYINIRRGLTFEAFKATVDFAHAANKAVIAQPIGPTVYAHEAVLAGADILEHAAGVSYSVARDPSVWNGWGNDEIHSLDLRPFADMDDAKAADLIKLMIAKGTHLELDLIAEGRGLHRQSRKWFEEDVKLLSDPNLAYIPPNAHAKWLANYAELNKRSPVDLEKLKLGYKNYEKFVLMFVKAGGKVLAGDDTSYSGWAVPGVGVQREMQLMVDAGLTPMQAIMAATRNTAEAFRVQDRIGTIGAGRFADLVILDANPLADIQNVEKISQVIQNGKVLPRTYNRTFKDRFFGDDLEAPEWYHALERLTKVEGNRTLAGLTDETAAFGQPAPGIGSISPLIKVEGGPAFTLTVKGVNFTTESKLFWGEHELPARLVSTSELEATIDKALIAEAGMIPIQVKNPKQNLAQQKWGAESNRASFIINIR
jgi:Amidohydrolase family